MDVRDTVFGIGSRRRFLGHLARLDLPVGPGDSRPVTEDDVESLPEPAQRYMRFMGVVGRPRDWSFRVRFVGGLRREPGKRWMHAAAWQYNTSLAVARIFDLRMDLGGVLPMFGSDTYVAGRGHMSGKLLNVLKVVDGSGREFDLGELVTYLNDACLLAPSMLLNDNVRFAPVDAGSFDVTLSDAGNEVTARVRVGADGRLVDFSTTDRWYAGPDGLVHARWTTPIEGWITNGDRRLPSRGRAIWHLETGEFEYACGRFQPGTLEFNVPPTTNARSPRGPATGQRRIGRASLDALSGVPLFVTAPAHPSLAHALGGHRRRGRRTDAGGRDRAEGVVQCDAGDHDRGTAGAGVAVDRADGLPAGGLLHLRAARQRGLRERRPRPARVPGSEGRGLDADVEEHQRDHGVQGEGVRAQQVVGLGEAR